MKAAQPLSILFTANTSWNIYNFRMALMRAIRARGHKIFVAAPEDEYSDAIRQEVDGFIPLIMQNAGTSIYHDAKLYLQYRRIIRQFRPDVMCAYTIKPNIYGTLAGAAGGVRIINNVSGLGTAFIKKSWLTHLVGGLYRLAFRHSDCVFFQNADDQREFIEQGFVASQKTARLPGSGVDLAKFSPQTIPKPGDQSTINFILIARMLWDKGIGEYVAACREVRKKFPEVRCVLMGPVGVENRTAVSPVQIEQWQREGVVEYWPESKDVRMPIARAQSVVLPSYREGMSRLLLEAAAMGKPLITTNVPGCRDIVEEGKNGLLCEVRNAEDLAAKMLEFLALDHAARQRMGENSRKKAEAEFSEDIVIEKYLEKIEALNNAYS